MAMAMATAASPAPVHRLDDGVETGKQRTGGEQVRQQVDSAIAHPRAFRLGSMQGVGHDGLQVYQRASMVRPPVTFWPIETSARADVGR
jgi:hypothetical protein